eukprot:scaffold43752_cov51-Attheya_sp.AAC.11
MGGGMTLARKKLKFVYPREKIPTKSLSSSFHPNRHNVNQPTKPYKFAKEKQQQEQNCSNNDHDANVSKDPHVLTTTKHSKPLPLEEETMDDILFPHKKKKMMKQAIVAVTEKTTTTNKQHPKKTQVKVDVEVDVDAVVGTAPVVPPKQVVKETKDKTLGHAATVPLSDEATHQHQQQQPVKKKSKKDKKRKNMNDSTVGTSSSSDGVVVVAPTKLKEEQDGDKEASSSSSTQRETQESSSAATRRDESLKRKRHTSGGTTTIEPQPQPPTPVNRPVLSRQLSGLSVEDAMRDKSGCRPRANSTDGELNLPQRGLCDERMVLESHKWKSQQQQQQQQQNNTKQQQSHRGGAPRGLVNLGNTCFLNATLQCLAYLPTFGQCIADLDPPPNNNNANNTNTNTNTKQKSSKKGNNGQRTTLLLRSLLRKMHNLDEAQASKNNPGGAIAPRNFVKVIPTLGGSGGHKFRPGRQEDAHEFLVHLLDAMKDGELGFAGIDQRVSGWRDRLPIPRLDETTLIHRMFGGYLRSQVCCTNCDYRSNTYDPFLDVALEVSKKSSNSVPAAFAEFTRKERLDSANQWKCSGCKKRVCASKQLTIFRPPLSLCLQLKRFTFGGDKGGGGGWGHGHFAGKGIGKMMRGGSKITKPIDFPANLHLPLSNGRKCDYSLTGMVIHVGNTASSGHYTAFVKKPGSRDGQNQWYHMDDSYVEAVSEKVVLQQKDAYLLFYCRKEVKLELPALPSSRKSMTESEAKEYGLARARARAASIDSSDLPSKSKLSGSVEQKDSDHDERIKESRPMKVRSVVSKEEKKPIEDRKVDTSKKSKEKSKKIVSNSKDESDVKKDAMTHAQVPSKKEVVSPLLSAILPSSLQKSNESEEEQSSSSSSDSSSSSSTSSSSSSAEDDESVENQNKSLSGVRKHLDSTMAKAENDATPKISNKQVSSHEDGDSSTLPLESNGIAPSIHKSPKALRSEHSTSITQEDDATQKTKRSDVKQKKQTMVLDNHQPGKIEIVVGSFQKTNLWKPAVLPSKSDGHSDNELLGTFKIQKWDDEDEVPEKSSQREAALKIMEMKNQERKRKMRLNRWDSALDEGRVSA